MTTLRPVLPVGADGKTAEPHAIEVLRLVPADEWTTTEAVTRAAIDRGIAAVDAAGPVVAFTVAGVPIERVLRVLRRHGWVIYNRHVDPPRYQRTPTGSVALDRAATVTLPAPRTYT